MSQLLDPVQPELDSPSPEPSRSASAQRNILVWCVGACCLLVGSGAVRGIQASRHQEDKGYLVECPFPLSTIPRTFGGWHVLEGSETILDPLTTRITGSTDYIIRTYVGETGVMLSVLILFGPAEPVLPHTPQVCYPSSGFQGIGETIDREIKIDGRDPARFRSAIFAKSGGRSLIRQAVYHSFRLDGPWTPAVAGRKFPRKNPGIFKVQIQRRVVDGEKRGEDEPIEDFVRSLVPVLEKMILTAETANTPKPSPPRTKGDQGTKPTDRVSP